MIKKYTYDILLILTYMSFIIIFKIKKLTIL